MPAWRFAGKGLLVSRDVAPQESAVENGQSLERNRDGKGIQ